MGTKQYNDSLLRKYEGGLKKKIGIILISFAVMLGLAILFTAMGATDTTASDILKTIGSAVRSKGRVEGTQEKVILHLRLPRIALAIFGGFGLSVAGAAMQGVTRNPLVSPFTIGISNAAAFGASLSIVFGVGIFTGSELGIVFHAFIWALGCTVLVYTISKKVGMSPETIILTGIALNYLFSAATSMIKYFADEHKLASVVQWEFGSLNGAGWNSVLVVSVVVIICILLIYLFAPALNIMSAVDDEVAGSMGIHPDRVRTVVGVLAVLATAAVISFTGVISFVGLAGPHIARMVIGNDHRYLIPFSAVTGALLMLVADTIGRLVLAPVIIPVGIVISFLGVPIFVNLILTKRKGDFR